MNKLERNNLKSSKIYACIFARGGSKGVKRKNIKTLGGKPLIAYSIESAFKNAFIDGSLIGKITILPFFNFNLDLDLNSINFTKLYNYFLSLEEKKQKNLFNINNKINVN